jgi:hypothetical protein
MIVFTGIIFYNIAILAFAMALGGILYQHIVEFRNWRSNIPQSLIAYREFFKKSDFGSFFKMFMPASFLCLVVSVAMLWNYSTSVRIWMLIGVAGMFLTAGFTNSYFVSKHKKLFEEPIDISKTLELKEAAEQWRKGNYARMILMGLTLMAMLEGLKLLR